MDWKLVRNACTGEPEIDVFDDNDVTWGRSLLRELAADPNSGLTKLSDGVYTSGNERSPVDEVRKEGIVAIYPWWRAGSPEPGE